jgi:hypothetical protein
MEDSSDGLAEGIEAPESVPDAADHETSDIHQQRRRGMLTPESRTNRNTLYDWLELARQHVTIGHTRFARFAGQVFHV